MNYNIYMWYAQLTNETVKFDAWEQRKLGDVVKFYSGLTYHPDDVQDKGTLVIRSSNIQSGQIVSADNVYVDTTKATSTTVKIGDIITVVRNGSRSLIGKHALVRAYSKHSYVIGAFMTGIRSNQPQFINALLDSTQFSIEIRKNLGATINQITTGNFKKMTFNFPNSSEQQEIGMLFSNIDSLIAANQCQQKGLEKLISESLNQEIILN
ncbi:Type-1 restriction enzyme EcoKI specificity protein [Lentilactobacillus parabuchneri]|uniref:restriction endonuclease subunit S n=1 Tax=Lentilactobacillus parabuchneri TaxID=152331 RepID=UPI000A1076CD|nr:Type-1 restriction enzyme EcoKI specificity protein [Lentilactobacillus parabuchneri]